MRRTSALVVAWKLPRIVNSACGCVAIAGSTRATAFPCTSVFTSAAVSLTNTIGRSRSDVRVLSTTTSFQVVSGRPPMLISLPSPTRVRCIGHHWKNVLSSPIGLSPASRALSATQAVARISSSVPASRPRIASLAIAYMSRRRSVAVMALKAGAIAGPLTGAPAVDAVPLAPVLEQAVTAPESTRAVVDTMPTSTRRISRCGVSLTGARSDSRADDGFDPATNVEITNDLHPTGLRDLREVIENAIDRAFVEDAVVPEAPEIELETLQLDADVAGDVRDMDGREVRRAALQRLELARIGLDAAHGAQRRELRTFHRDLIIAIGIRVREDFEEGRVGHRAAERRSGGAASA